MACIDCFPYVILFEDFDSTLTSAISSPIAVEALPAWVTITIDNSVQPRRVILDRLGGRPNLGDLGLTGPHQVRVSDGTNTVDTDEFTIDVVDLVVSPLVNIEYEGASPSTGGISLILFEGASPEFVEQVFQATVLAEEFEGASPSTGGVSLVLFEGASPEQKDVSPPSFTILNVESEGASPPGGGISLLLYEGASP